MTNICVCVCTHPPNAQPHSPPHTCTCTPTTPHSTVRKDSHVALRAGLDKGCYFDQCFWSPSRQAWLLPQSKQGPGRTFWSLRSTPVFLLFITQRPAGGAAPCGDRPVCLCSGGGQRVTGKSGSGSARVPTELWPWQTHMMTHRFDEGLCQKQWGSGVTAQWKSKCFRLPGQGSHLLTIDSGAFTGRMSACEISELCRDSDSPSVNQGQHYASPRFGPLLEILGHQLYLC